MIVVSYSKVGTYLSCEHECCDILSQLNNPDVRVNIVKDFVKKNFPSTALLDYALQVEQITTCKVIITHLVQIATAVSEKIRLS